ncbi:MAG TPA: hypothetical protein VF796_24060 [Humisphaera sp.]
MGLVDALAGALGGGNTGGMPMGGMPGGGGGASPLGSLLHRLPLDQLSGLFGQTARNMDGQQYRDHVTPGVGGTNPLGMLKGPALAVVAGMLMKHLAGGRGAAAAGGGGGLGGMLGSVLGGGGGGGAAGMGGLGGLLSKIPGLQTADPHQMDPGQVAALADYARQHDPDAFGRAAAEAGRQDPDVLHALLGGHGVETLTRLAGGQG